MKKYLYFEGMKVRENVSFDLGEETISVGREDGKSPLLSLITQNDGIPVIHFKPDSAYDLSNVDFEKIDPSLWSRQPVGEENSEAVEALFGDTVIFHAHKHIEIDFLLSGEMMYLVNGRLVPHKAGEILIFGSQVPHAWKKTVDSSVLQYINIDPSWFHTMELKHENERHLYKQILKGRFFYKLEQRSPIYSDILACFQHAIKENQRKQTGYHSMIHADITKLMVLLGRNLEGNISSGKRDGHADLALRKALQYMEEHCAERITLESVSDQLFLNRTYFSTLFKKKMGVNFSEYLTRIRMAKAANLLENTESKIIEVAYACGFSSIAHFNQTFKRMFFCTPSQYRKRLKKSGIKSNHSLRGEEKA